MTATQDLYPDIPGKIHVFDSTHSSRVKLGDAFLYLDKSKQYAITGTGMVGRITSREPTAIEALPICVPIGAPIVLA